VTHPLMPADRALAETAGYARPWVVSPGEMVDLHASLARDSLVDVVRIECANAERTPDGATIGPAPRLIPVPQAPARWCAAHPQPLDPGTRIDVRLVRPYPAVDTTLLIALQWMARGTGGHVVSLLGEDGAGWRIDLHRGTDRSARVSLRTDAGMPTHDDAQGGVLKDLAVPVGAWLILCLRPSVEQGGCLQVRSAIGNASLPDPKPRDWFVHEPIGVNASGGGSHLTFSRLRIGAGEDRSPCADVRIDLLSLVPRALADRLRPDELFASDPALSRCPPGSVSWWAPTCRHAGPRPLRGRLRAVRPLRQCRLSGDSAALYRRARCALGRPVSVARAGASALHGLPSAQRRDAGCGLGSETVVAGARRSSSGCYAFRMDSQHDGPEAVRYASFFVSAATRPAIAWPCCCPPSATSPMPMRTEEMRGPPISAAARHRESRQCSTRCHPAYGRSIYERHADGQGVLYASSRRPLAQRGARPSSLAVVADTLVAGLAGGHRPGLRRDHRPRPARLGHGSAGALCGAVDRPPPRILEHADVGRPVAVPARRRPPDVPGRQRPVLAHGLQRGRHDRGAPRRRRHTPAHRAPGEYHCAFSGEFGGLWRRLGRPPQQIVGVGMAAQGFERAAHYPLVRRRWRTRSCLRAPRASLRRHFGITRPALGGGASGWEIDRIDADLGTPAGTWWLARSEGPRTGSMLRTKEELLSYIAAV
jgi:hypothetical protein